MGFICKADYSIDYEYVDKDNNLTYKGFLKYLVDAGSKHSAIAGYGLKDIPRTGLAWLVLSWKVKIYKRPGAEELIHVETWCRGTEKVYCYRDYKIYDKSNELIAIASSKWVLFDVNKKTIAHITEDVVSAYNPNNENVFNEPIEKLTEPTNNPISTYEYKIMRRDIDTNNHVHNTNYIDIAIECLPKEIYENSNYTNIEVMYKHQAVLGDIAKAIYYHKDDGDYVVIKSNDLSKLHCIVKFN